MQSIPLMLDILLMLIWLWFARGYDNCEPKRKIYSSLIWYHSRKGLNPNELRIHEYVHNFTTTIFKDVPDEDIVKIKLFPPVFTPACEGTEEAGNMPDKGRGSNLAHKEVWYDFYRHRRPCGEKYGDRLIVFEYDAFPGSPTAGQIVINTVKSLQTDFHFLGYCYKNRNFNPRVIPNAPYCLHAYVISIPTARLLLDEVEACGAFADVQVANLCNSKNMTWSYQLEDYDRVYLNDYFVRDGIHIGGPYLKGGIIVQAKLDHVIVPVENQVCYLGKALFLFQNGTWRSVPNTDTLAAMGIPFAKAVPITQWQLSQYPMGSPLPAKTVS